MDRFGLIKWRKSRSLTQSDLASLLGVSRRTINSWEAGISLPGDIDDRLTAVANGAPEAPAKLPNPKWINHRTAPHLYIKMSGSPVKRPIHPVRLLGPHVEVECEEDGVIYRRVPWTILTSDEYRAALARMQGEPERPASGVKGLPDESYWDELNNK